MNLPTLRRRALVVAGVFAASLSLTPIALRAEKAAGRDPATKAIMEESAAQIAALRLDQSSLQVGQKLPSFELTDSTGAKVSSAALLAKGPLVLTFYRGGWCPFCNKALSALAQLQPRFAELGATLVAITPEAPDLAAATTVKNQVSFPVLTDADNAYAKKLGIVFAMPAKLDELYASRFKVDLRVKHQSKAAELPVPATYVVARDGRIVWRFFETDYTKRADPEEILAALKSLAAKSNVAVPAEVAGYSALLKEHVARGLVNYAAVKRDERLGKFLTHAAKVKLDALPGGDAGRLAFWINAYNAYTLHLIAEHLPLKSINDLASGGKWAAQQEGKTPWDVRFAVVGGKTYTLNEIENQVIRPQFKEPRIHFALVCAALGCPLLRNEAYTAERLSEQLDEQGRGFLQERNRFELTKKGAGLSKVFDWYGVDFGATETERLRYLAKFAPAEVATSLSEKPEQWKVSYLNYDWTLNGR